MRRAINADTATVINEVTGEESADDRGLCGADFTTTALNLRKNTALVGRISLEIEAIEGDIVNIVFSIEYFDPCFHLNISIDSF